MRISPLSENELSERQLQIMNDIVHGPRGGGGSVMMVWLHSPELADLVQKVGAYFRVETILPSQIMEMIVLVVARHWRCDMIWFYHAPLALKKGLAPEIIESIRRDKRPAFSDLSEAAAYDFATSMLVDRDTSDEIIEKVKHS